MRRAFRKGGLSFNHAAELLYQAGYPVTDEKGNYSPNALLDRIDQELRGDKVYSIKNEAEFQRQADEHYENERQAAEQAAKDLLAREPERATQDAKFMELWRHPELEGARKMASDAWNEAKTLKERTDLIAELQEMLDEKRTASREAPGASRETTEALTLHAEDAAELKARGEREQAESDAQQLAVRIAGERDRADRELSEFSLTGSDRVSDSNPNQTDLVRAAMEERPLMEIPDAQGRMIDAAPALEQAQLLEDQAKAEADKAFKTAADCFNQGGST
jgi:hypothetical protein